MPEDTPTFSSIPLEDGDQPAQPEKPARKKRQAVKKTAAEIKNSLKIQNAKQNEIDKQITSIYRDSNGRLPDMKMIKIKKSHPILRFFSFLVAVGVVLAAAAWAGLFLLPGHKNISDDQAGLSIDGPADIVPGATTTYTLTYQNNQNIVLNNVVLNIQYPEGFVFSSSDLAAANAGNTQWSLGSLSAYQKHQLNITGQTYGSVGQQQSWRAFLTYRPADYNSDLQKAAVLNISFTQSPFLLAIAGPDKATIGDSAQYTYTVSRSVENRIAKLELVPSLPANFYITSSSPLLGKNKSWVFSPNPSASSTASSSAGGQLFSLSGKFSSSTDQSSSVGGSLNVIADAGSFGIAQASVNTQLVQNNLNFGVSINGSTDSLSAQPGDMLNISVDFTNQSGGTLKNATLRLDVDAPSLNRQSALDWSKIDDKYDGDIKGMQLSDAVRRGEITWNKTKITDLALIKPNQEITVDLHLPIKALADFDFPSLANYTINANAVLDFTDQSGIAQSFSANPVAITLNSDLKMETRDSVSDSNTHDVTWVLTNNFHPLKNLTLSANIYGDVDVEIGSSTPAGQVNYDQQNKTLTWTVSDMPQEVNVLALPFTIRINKTNPSQNMLVSKVHVQADDTVTGQKLDFMGDEIMLSQ